MNLFSDLKKWLKSHPLRDITRAQIFTVADRELQSQPHIVEDILRYRSADIPVSVQDERVFPGDQGFLESGYYKTMLGRYFYAAAQYCKSKSVLDSCSGLGWGSYIIAHYAKQVVAFDNNPEILSFCKKNWNKGNIQWLEANALALDLVEDHSFDIALAMETIEHFSAYDGKAYLLELVKKVKAGGLLIGTSAFPNSTEEAEIVCKRNPAHLHIFTVDEIREILHGVSRDFVIVDQWMFIARL